MQSRYKQHLSGKSSTKRENIAVYEQVLRDHGARFPYKFFHGQAGQKRAADITRYLIREKLRIPLAAIPEKVNFRDTFLKYRLASMVNTVFSGSTYKAVDNAFPGQFEPWEGTLTPKGFWQGENGRHNAAAAMRWLIEKRLKLSEPSVPRKLTPHVFSQFKLDRMFKAFGGSVFRLVELAYPGKYRSWQFKQDRECRLGIPNETTRMAIRWLVKEKLDLDPDLAPAKVTKASFYLNNLDMVLDRVYMGSVAAALMDAYPGRFSEKDFLRPGMPVSVNTQLDLGMDAIRMYEDVLNERQTAFPYRYFKSREGRRRAAVIFRYLVENKLQLPVKDAPNVVTMRLLKKYRLSGMCSSLGRSVRAVVENAYPGKFSASHFRNRRKS